MVFIVHTVLNSGICKAKAADVTRWSPPFPKQIPVLPAGVHGRLLFLPLKSSVRYVQYTYQDPQP